MQDLAPEPLARAAWLDIVAREYLDGFVPAGGGALKIAVVDDAEVAPISARLAALAGQRGLRAVAIDAARTRLHLPQDVFFALARALPWTEMVQTYLEALFAANDYPWPRPGIAMARPALAEALGVAPPLLNAAINTWLTRGIWGNRDYAQDFRSALLALCQAVLETDQAEAAPVLAWLHGEKVPAAQLRASGIGGRITRAGARAMLVSLCHWVRHSGAGGLVVTLDVRRLHHTGPVAEGEVRYTPAAVMDTYEVLRELIDDTENLPGLFVVVLANPGLIGGEPRRALDAYDALRMRVWPDVRPGAGQNPVAPLVWLGA
jgi:hypothetical protein